MPRRRARILRAAFDRLLDEARILVAAAKEFGAKLGDRVVDVVRLRLLEIGLARAGSATIPAAFVPFCSATVAPVDPAQAATESPMNAATTARREDADAEDW